MYVREIKSPRQPAEAVINQPRQKHLFFRLLLLILLITGLFFLGHSHASGRGTIITSGYKGYCLDNYRDQNQPGNKVDIWSCDGGASQTWMVSLTQIKKPNNLCLNAVSISNVTLSNCNQSSQQIWLEDGRALYNPHFSMCLVAVKAGDGQTLALGSCSQNSVASQVFSPSVDISSSPCTGSQGDVVACVAEKQWILWQAHPNQRQNYLNTYTGGSPYEEWCADFVSYVYKEAGHPFTNGNYNNWDENIADDIQNQGFTINQSGSYVPKPGDVAYFDYPGGHVEIVIAGGKDPTFIYGDSDTIDPIINNGAMDSNDVQSKPNLGSLQYYMSRNSNT
jgi:hypothetical protein